MNILVNMTDNEVLSVMVIDCPKYATDERKFFRLNRTTYEVALNTWLYIVYEGCGFRAARVLKSALLSQGLWKTISECDEAANSLIVGHGDMSDVARALITEDEKVTLQCLRYLKRFNPIGADKLADSTIESFLKLNTTRKGVPSVLDRANPKKVQQRATTAPRWLVNAVKEKCSEMLSKYETSEHNQSFTNGTCADGTRVLAQKLSCLARHQVNLFDSPLYPIGKETTYTEVPDSVHVVPVPKNYKKDRVIAETYAYHNFYLNGVRQDVEHALRKTSLGRQIHLDDQGINQELARLGSIYNVYATVDLTGASDSIPDCFAKAVLPNVVYDAVNKYNAPFIEVNGKKFPRYIFQTSGNPTTFCLETVIFLAICEVARDYVELFAYQADPDHYKDCMRSTAYGDDMIVDVAVYETLCDFLHMCGFTVNKEKSFSSESDYRESCGVEFRKGIDLHTVYYPRQQVKNDEASIASLISLQHRLFSYTLAAAWLTDYIKAKLVKLSAPKKDKQLGDTGKSPKASKPKTPEVKPVKKQDESSDSQKAKPDGKQPEKLAENKGGKPKPKPQKSDTGKRPANQSEPSDKKETKGGSTPTKPNLKVSKPKKPRKDGDKPIPKVKTTEAPKKVSTPSDVAPEAKPKKGKVSKPRFIITSSPIGTDCDDLWDYVPDFKLIDAPFDHSKMKECPHKRELHMTLKTSYETVRGLTDTDYERLEMYYYTQWLRLGAPTIASNDNSFASYLARECGWTKSIKDIPRDTGIPVPQWKTTKR